MSRLIDADALLEVVNAWIFNVHDNRHVEDLIKDAPTVQREGWVSVPIEPTEEMLDFDKWFNSSMRDPTIGITETNIESACESAWQAATTEANKRIAELEQDRNDLNYLCMERLHKIEELQASNNRLREAIAEIAAEAQDTYTNAALTKLLSATPAESLQAFDELIEK